MKWLLIITLFGADGDVTRVSYGQSSEDVCEKSASYYMERYEAEGTEAAYKCVPNSEFVTEERVR